MRNKVSMNRNTDAGLTLKPVQAARRSARFIQPVLASALFLALVTAFGRMCGLWPTAGLYLAGLALIAVCAFLPAKKREIAAVLFLLFCTAALFLWPTAGEGAKLIYTRLFAVSEAHNAYRYNALTIHLTQSQYAFAQTAAALFLTAIAACASILCANQRTAALILFLMLSVFETYFGVTPGIICNLLLFSALALCLAIRAQLPAAPSFEIFLFFAVLVLSGAVLVALTLPGVNPQVEQYSEHLRDRLDEAARTQLPTFLQAADELTEVRHENPLHAESAGGVNDQTRDYQDYEVKQEYESEISQPDHTRYGKVIWLTLLILALLTLPFLPFLLYDARRRRIKMMCLDFESPYCALAIHAMFLHIAAWHEVCGLHAGNRSFSACCDDIAVKLSPAYAQHYRSAVALWQESEYSSHEMNETQRAWMREFLDETQHLLYGQAGWLKKLKLKYIHCLVI